MKQKHIASLTTLALGCGLSLALSSSIGAVPVDNVKEILELTGGRRVKAVWNQGAENALTLKYLDTKDGQIIDLPFSGSAPLITLDGRRVFASTGKAKERKVMAYDTETKKVVELAKEGPGNNLMAVWTDPKTKKEWVYVNDCGDNNEAWNAPAGKIYRFPVDKPAARELFWERTSSHIYLMFSADGTRACFEPSWSNIGQLNIVYDAQGKCDQEKSVYKTVGGGCFPSMAPDDSYRLFRLEGDHKGVSMTDADGANARKVDVTGSLTEEQLKGGKNTWLTRWSTHPRFISLVAPAGPEAQIHLGRLDEGATKFEAWVRISEAKGPQCWQSQVWIDPQRASATPPKRK